MGLWDLESLNKKDFIDENGEPLSLYDLTQQTYIFAGTQFRAYLISSDDEMRIDKVCTAIYGSNKYADTLLNINYIINPINIKKDAIIIYPPESAIESFKLRETDVSIIKDKLINLNPNTRKDKNRTEYNKHSTNLPVTFTDKGSAIDFNKGKITIGK